MKKIGIKSILSVLCALMLMFTITVAQNHDIPITSSSDEARNIYKEGRAYMENIHFNKAAGLFDKAIKLDPNFALAYVDRAVTNVGGFNVAKKNIDKAVSLIDKVTGGEKNLILYIQASINGDELRQKMFLDNLIVSFPSDKRVQQIAGLYYMQISDYKTALTHLRKSVSIDENFAPSYNNIGYAELALENFAAAEKAFKRYIELVPDQPNPYDSYAELLMKEGKYDESITQYQKAYDKDNTFTFALIGLGNNYVFKQDYNKAREYYDMIFKKATSINEKLTALYWTATSYLDEGKTDAALKTLEQRGKLAEKEGIITTAFANTNLEGLILTEMGQVKKGMEKYRIANKMVESSNLPKETKTNLELTGRINMCYSLAANDKISEAEKEAKLCEEMVNKRGNKTEMQNLHTTLALLEMKKGNFKEAISYFEKTDLNNTPFNMQKIGIAYEKMGNTQMANKFFDKAKTSNQNGIGYALIRRTVKD